MTPEWKEQGNPLWRFLQRVERKDGSRILALLGGSTVYPLYGRHDPKYNVVRETLYRFARRYLAGRAHITELHAHAKRIASRYHFQWRYFSEHVPRGIGLVRVDDRLRRVTCDGDIRREGETFRIYHGEHYRENRLSEKATQLRLAAMDEETRRAHLLTLDLTGALRHG